MTVRAGVSTSSRTLRYRTTPQLSRRSRKCLAGRIAADDHTVASFNAQGGAIDTVALSGEVALPGGTVELVYPGP